MKTISAFRKICKNLNNYENTDEFKEAKKLIEKELKALNIIRYSDCDVFWVRFAQNLEKCNAHQTIPLTQEEFDLLKEVLL